MAQAYLGDYYGAGFDGKENKGKAREYYEMAAAQNSADSLYNLATVYFNGNGVEKDGNKAMKYLERAAALG